MNNEQIETLVKIAIIAGLVFIIVLLLQPAYGCKQVGKHQYKIALTNGENIYCNHYETKTQGQLEVIDCDKKELKYIYDPVKIEYLTENNCAR